MVQCASKAKTGGQWLQALAGFPNASAYHIIFDGIGAMLLVAVVVRLIGKETNPLRRSGAVRPERSAGLE
ncbi:hypothetical protein [Alicyclobacillus kakegawensis]|uniref:hypothetical protein n=1 Tax=Alicyclobacillus kakegawensis TaxID=392012 RepID=UPI00083348B2|nr:hypothetical protein [Alicyclobacillus kakegawensis]